eukprot:11426759-Alexandrium_andersonii.AAC.1
MNALSEQSQSSRGKLRLASTLFFVHERAQNQGDKKGEKVFTRHRVNSRNEADSRRQYRNLISTNGIYKDLRSPPWSIPDSPNLSVAAHHL